MKADDCLRDIRKQVKNRLPRGYAYMRFRNKGYSIDVEFPRTDEPLVELVMQKAMQVLRESTPPPHANVPKYSTNSAATCTCPIEDWRDVPMGPFCLVCGKPTGRKSDGK